MSHGTLQCRFVGVSALVAIIVIILAALGIVRGWVIAIAIIGGFGGEMALLCHRREYYMRRYRDCQRFSCHR